MSWVRIWIHLVFSTKNRVPFLDTPELRLKVFKHIKDNAATKKIWLDCVNGYNDHVHCLISLGKDEKICNIAHLIKGESSYWINKNELTKQKFSWQDDYWAVSLGESDLMRIRNYIYNQEKHHAKRSFREEIEILNEKFGWKNNEHS